VPDSIEHGVDGYLVDIGDFIAMSNYVKKIYGEGELKNRLITNGLNKVKSYTVEKFAAVFIDEINKLRDAAV